ncbi:cAMP-dependent protein kinase type II regulatory subunit isoform X1 [Musca domestica]|uniref:cAMP-dependent protein kinase type II regulatory subunit n=1 Tax=Musca domestica TaxID=7370 RepID=A0A9J7DDV2_MUSDO|nr:cAMP-dependent protein kinase type II regulatory subunit isoform X1 [Musca domestica]XP_019890408.1 cAMP-dependent protein kinase type II regulatory subunit isoform X1 [Musca domestica]XP_019890409.1 cAMP-dependent protein kinase type II regulatory subunit isoform X1 [Musca domestica]XP_019890410.1 cAMP-dependent protein kinase type II regulatory subunit isoform X1 [Musca domestica]XP_019890411.1 cAMP-dependent protein kinase type II regulatory subunit isoform X1 [Musca domestica]XP_0198904
MSNEQKQRIQVPDALREVLLEFSIAYLLEQPGDVVDFAVEYFTKLQETRRQSAFNRDNDRGSVDDSVMSQEDDDEPVVPRFSNRRKSVFAEAYDPENDADDDEGATAVFPKSDEQRSRLIESVKNVLLFRSLEKEQMNQVLDAMFERRVSPGENIIRQGDDGDNFYVIESGVYKVIVNDNHVHTYTNSGIFGELALLYNMPRAATIQAESEGLLWAMDRQTFRRILLKSAFKKRKMYESLLDSVPMLKTLQSYERMNLADALVTKRFNTNDRIIKQGDVADGMYFIEEGTVVIKMDQDGSEIEISKLGKGAYFGELALVTHRPRAASVYAASDDVKVAFLDTECFERLLGPCTKLLKRAISEYRYLDDDLRSYFTELNGLEELHL